jgi:hypothetical protein
MPVIMFSGGVPGASPDEIAGLQLWYDAAQFVYEDEAATDLAEDADVIRSWVDAKNSYKVWTTGGAATGPAYDVDGANGYPCVTFDATGDYLNSNDSNADNYLGTRNTILVAAKSAVATPVAGAYFVLFWDGATIITLGNVAGAQSGRASNDDGATDSATHVVGATLAQWRIYTFMNNGTNVYCGVDDTRTASMTSAASGNTVFGAATNLYIRNTVGDIWSIAEVVQYNVALSEADRQLIEQRMAYKYGVSLGY